MKAAILSHRDLFRGIDYDHLPSLERLLSIGRGLRQGQTRDAEMPEDLQREAWGHLDPIHELCRYHGHIPLLTELAIIADRRSLSAKEQNYFVSFISVFSPDADAVATSYVGAMDHMRKPEGGGAPIIPHPGLYDPDNALIVVELGTFPGEGLDLTAVSREPQRREVYRYPFELNPSPKREVLEQVTQFADVFVSGLSASTHALHTSLLFRGAKLLLLPFVRPHYEPATADESAQAVEEAERANHLRASPGGAVLLFLLPQDPASGVDDIARDLAWLLAAGSVNESYSSFDVTLRRQQLLGRLIHGTTNAIRSINTAELGRLLCKPGRVPPQSADDLRVQITTPDGQDDPGRRNAVAISLKKSMLAEDTAAALLAFAETRYWRGAVRKKFQNGVESDLGKIIEEAFLLADIWREAPGGRYAPVDLDTSIRGPKGQTDGRWMLPPRYLNAKMIRGILAELMMNASVHGLKEQGVVSIHCTVREADSGGVFCDFVNKMALWASEEHPRELASGFLVRTREALADLDGMDLIVEPPLDTGMFHGRLWMGPIRAVVGSRIEDTKLVSPRWVPLSEEDF